MSEEQTSTPPERPSGSVRWIELPQVISAAAVGGIVLALLAMTADERAAWNWQWWVLGLTAVVGFVLPFILARKDTDHIETAYYVATPPRLATLEEIKIPKDIVEAIKETPPFAGTGEQLRVKLYDSVGEARGSEYIHRLYRYLRAEKPAEKETKADETVKTDQSSGVGEVGVGKLLVKTGATPESAPPPSPA